MTVIMSKLNSEEVFENQLKVFIGKYASSDSELVEFLREIHASKLYFEYYSRFTPGHYDEVMTQFKKLAKNTKATHGQLRNALLLTCSDIQDLTLQLEDYKQDEESRKIDREDEMMDSFQSGALSARNWSILNTVGIIAILGVLLFL